MVCQTKLNNSKQGQANICQMFGVFCKRNSPLNFSAVHLQLFFLGFSVLLLVLSLCLLLDGVHISANWFRFDLMDAAGQTDKFLDRKLREVCVRDRHLGRRLCVCV